jgi:pimeloyl-ACP methyl ester carboxylesterase
MADAVRMVDSGGIALAVRHAPAGGSTVPVVLVHGLGSDAWGTWETTGWLRAIQVAGRRWIAPDLRGHGDSDRPRDPDSYRLPVMVADLEAVLDDAGAARVDVVGYSLGARIAVEFADARPSRVRRLVLGGFGDPSAVRSSASFTQLLDHLPASADPDAIAACCAGASGGDVLAAAARVRAPVLLVAGDADEIASDVGAAAGRFPDARAEQLPGRNHFSALSAKRFKQLGLDFLSQGE